MLLKTSNLCDNYKVANDTYQESLTKQNSSIWDFIKFTHFVNFIIVLYNDSQWVDAMLCKPITISLTKDLWNEVDNVRQDVSRSMWVKRAVEARLKELKKG